MLVKDLCITDSGGEDCANDGVGDDITRLDVSFRRPKFKGLFFAEGYGGVVGDIQSAKIVVGAANGFNDFVVEVTSLGQISVYKAP